MAAAEAENITIVTGARLPTLQNTVSSVPIMRSVRHMRSDGVSRVVL